MDIFGFENFNIKSYRKAQDAHYLEATYISQIPECKICGNSGKIHGHGSFTKKIRDIPLRGKPLIVALSIKRYRCLRCDRTFTQYVPEVSGSSSLTQRFITYLEQFCLRLDSTFASVSRDNFISETMIREIFVRYVEREEKKWSFKTPRLMGLDGVYIARRERLIVTDLEKNIVVALQNKANMYDAGRALLDLPDLEHVDAVVIDMSTALLRAAETIIKATSKRRDTPLKVVIDKYHVQRMVNQALVRYLSMTKKDRAGKTYESFTRNRFLLIARRYNLSDNDKLNLDQWLSDEPELSWVYELKEQFFKIWHLNDKDSAKQSFAVWKDSIPFNLRRVFKNILTSFNNWGEYIFNYFDFKITNAFTESANNLIKSIAKRTRGCAFWVVRAKTLNHYYQIEIARGNIDRQKQSNSLQLSNPAKSQRVLRLKNAYRHCSRIFEITYPKMNAWRERFAVHLKKIDGDKS